MTSANTSPSNPFSLGSETDEDSEVGASAPRSAGAPADLPVRIREFAEGDKNLILNTWLKSNRNNKPSVNIPNDIYYPGQQLVVANIASRASLFCLCKHDDSNEVYGWLCWEKAPDGSLIIHYAYVKTIFRQFGLARKLLEATGWKPGVSIWATHWGRVPEKIKGHYRLKFNPFILMAGFR